MSLPEVCSSKRKVGIGFCRSWKGKQGEDKHVCATCFKTRQTNGYNLTKNQGE